MTAPAFTAWCQCPRCDLIDCHRMRAPHMVDKWEMLQYQAAHAQWEADGYEHHTIRSFDGTLVREVYHPAPPPRPRDESEYEVIRTCQCGHEFGQR
jgi:hypothetical protein